MNVLADGGRVDFPTVTDICENVVGDAEETQLVAEALAMAMQATPGMVDCSRHLKALTIAHELLYDVRACRALFEAPGFWQQLNRLHDCPAASGSGPLAESMSILSNEIHKKLFSEFCCRV